MRALVLALAACTGAPLFAQVPLFDVTDPDVPLDQAIGAIGDVDGDGLPDFAVGSPAVDFVGTDSGVVRVYRGVNAALLFEVFGAEAQDQIGEAVDGAGDVNADGVPDVIAGSGIFHGNRARVWSGADGSLLYDLTAGAQDSFGHAVAGFGDADLDGFDDFAVSAIQDFVGLPGYVRLYSGASGAQLKEYAGGCNSARFGNALARLGDVTGDGAPDLGVYMLAVSAACTSEARVFSLAGLEHTFSAAGTFTGGRDAVGLAGDVDGDGLGDVVVGTPGAASCFGSLPGNARVYSGATGAVLMDVSGEPGCTWLGYGADGIGDLDGDGRADVAIASTGPDRIDVFSGLDASVLRSFTSPIQKNFGYAVVGLGDLDGDGSLELGSTGPGGGAWVMSSCPGAIETFGAGCGGSGGIAPELGALGCPSPGNTVVLRVRKGYGSALAFLAIGTGGTSLPLTASCNLLVAPLLVTTSIGTLFDFGPGVGYRDVPIQIPASAAGQSFFFQEANVDPGAADLFAVSNGLRIDVP